HDHQVVEKGAWNDWRSCWFNGLYMRVVPSHAAEMTSAFLHRRVTDTLERLRVSNATAQQRLDLAAVIHLCGAGAARAYAANGFRAAPAQRCGSHHLDRYLADVRALTRVFARLQVP
ncbi:MAG TPA: hypothetical protein VEB23_00910, partial [Ramlibacter sp.]|nr:hypothetical protein [Ramlibacter sp.]